MHWIKSFIFCSFIMMLKVGADILTNDEISHELSALSTTLTPIVLQMSTQQVDIEHQELTENESDFTTPSTELRSKPAENNEILNASENNLDKKISSNKNNQHQTPNDVEVFEHKPGPIKEKQEEEPEAEPEAEEAAAAEEEAPAEEEAAAEPEAEPEPAAEEEAKEEEAAAEPEAEPAAEEEAKEEEKVEAEPEAQPEETQTPENDEKEMSNDEPAKEDDPAPHISVDPTIDAKDNKSLSCFSCTSVDDTQCHIKTTHQENCPKVNAGDNGKHNGCYTLYKADTNITMRGCVDDLAEDGLKYCLTNDKLCLLCYTNACNNKLAPNTAAMQQLNVYLMIILKGFSVLVIKKIFI